MDVEETYGEAGERPGPCRGREAWLGHWGNGVWGWPWGEELRELMEGGRARVLGGGLGSGAGCHC